MYFQIIAWIAGYGITNQIPLTDVMVNLTGAEEGSQFRGGAKQPTRKIFYGKKLNPTEDS